MFGVCSVEHHYGLVAQLHGLDPVLRVADRVARVLNVSC